MDDKEKRFIIHAWISVGLSLIAVVVAIIAATR